ncbi:MAG: hypothetical protein LBO72_03030, partial [Helicobacteraceae bacterium]|nr:hypothetical protein [Helicobacteraceae bacterium]
MRIKAAFLAISAVCAIGAAADEIGEAIAAQKAEKRWSVPSGCKQIFTDGKTDRGYYLSYACFYPNQTLRQVYSGYLNGAIGQIDDYSRIAWKK